MKKAGALGTEARQSFVCATGTAVRSPARRAITRLGAVALLVALVPVSYASAQDPTGCSLPDQVVVEPDGWTRIRAPQFGQLPQTLTNYAVDPVTPERLFATNGRSLARSTDAGCTWLELFALPSEPAPGRGQMTIESIVVSPAVHDTVFVVIREDLSGSGVRARVLRSLDSGQSFTESHGELPGDPLKLTVSESQPDTAYLATVTTLAGSGNLAAESMLLFATHDSGATFEQVAPQAASTDGGVGYPPGFTDIAVDPLEVDQLWGVRNNVPQNGVWRSVDGGDSWTHLTELSGRLHAVDVFHVYGAAARIMAMGPQFSYRSDDGGETWHQLPAPAGADVDSVAHGADPDQILAVASTDDSGWAMGFDPSGPGWTVLKEANLPIHGAQADRNPQPAFYVAGDDRIWRSPTDPSTSPSPSPSLSAPPPLPSGNGCIPPDSSWAPPPPPPASPLLTPTDVVIELAPGESTVVPYLLELPKAPSPVDVFYLIDTTGSMTNPICAAVRSAAAIAFRLVKAGIDAHFGVGDYRDYPVAPYGYPGDHVYKRELNVSPPSVSLVRALQRLRAFGGLDGPEAQLPALYQLATGAGQHPFVLPGLQADFRPDSLRLVVDISDTGFHDEPGYPGNTWQETLSALNDKDIKHAGISFGGPTEDFKRAARGTGALATESVDCNGDGRPELVPGDPLVCAGNISGTSASLADAVVGMTLALRDDAPVHLVERGSSGVVAEITPGEYLAVNLKEANKLAFGVTYRCTAKQAGETVPVALGAHVRDELVAGATALIACGKPPLLALEVDKTNDADGDGIYTGSEVAPAEGAEVPFRADVTNTGDTPLTIAEMIDEFSGTRLDICSELIDTTVQPGETVGCDFELQGYAPAAEVLLENKITVTAAQPGEPDRVALGVGSSTVTTPGLPPPPAPPPPPPPPLPPAPPAPLGGFEPFSVLELPPELPPTFEPSTAQVLNTQTNPLTNPVTSTQTNPVTNPVTNAQTNPVTNQVTNVQTNAQANPQSQNQVQAQTHLQVQVGLAAQRQAQPQTAMAAAYDAVTQRPDHGYAMSERQDPLGQARATTALGAGGLLLAYGCLSLASRRAQVAKAGSQVSKRRGER